MSDEPWVALATITIIMDPQKLDEQVGVPLGTHGTRWAEKPQSQAGLLLDIMATPEAQARLAMVGGRVGLASYDLYQGDGAVALATEAIVEAAVEAAADPTTDIIDYNDEMGN